MGFGRTFTRMLASRTPEGHTATGEAVVVVEKALAQLSASQRAVVTLHLDAGLSPSEMAPLLGITANAARVTLHRGLEKLRVQLRAHGIESAPLPDERTLQEET